MNMKKKNFIDAYTECSAPAGAAAVPVPVPAPNPSPAPNPVPGIEILALGSVELEVPDAAPLLEPNTPQLSFKVLLLFNY